MIHGDFTKCCDLLIFWASWSKWCGMTEKKLYNLVTHTLTFPSSLSLNTKHRGLICTGQLLQSLDLWQLPNWPKESQHKYAKGHSSKCSHMTKREVFLSGSQCLSWWCFICNNIWRISQQKKTKTSSSSHLSIRPAATATSTARFRNVVI